MNIPLKIIPRTSQTPLKSAMFTMNMLKIIFFLFLFMTVNAHSQKQNLGAVVSSVKNFTDQYKNKPLIINLNQQNTPAGFLIACPIGKICPDEKIQLVYMAGTKIHPEDERETWIRLFFNIFDLEKVNLKSLKENFDFASFQIDLSHNFKFPGFLISFSESGKTGFVNRSDKSNWNFQELKNGILVGRLQKKLRSVSISRVDDWAAVNCNILARPRPKGCWEEIELDIPVELRFALPLELKPIDCQDAFNDHPRCGR